MEDGVSGVHVHQRYPVIGREVVAEGGADPARLQGAQGVAHPGSLRGGLHGDVVAAGDRLELGSAAVLADPMHAGAEGLGDLEPFNPVVEVVHDGGAVRDSEPRGVPMTVSASARLTLPSR